LTWLHHTADLWRKRDTQPNHHIWWATDVAPVLDAVSVWRGLEAKSPRVRASRGTGGGGAPMTTSPPVEDAAPAPGHQSDG